MLGSLIFGFVAGFLTTRVEPLLEGLIEKAMKTDLRIDALSFRVLTFSIMVLLAALLTFVLRGDSSAFLTIIGGVLGYFALDIYAFAQDPDRALGRDKDDWDGSVGEVTDAADEGTIQAVTDAVNEEEKQE